ncbi:hypothetical protein GGR58DRAFT_472526 [Xylaria digitata]|nr:hypothetical protein GGR58DRAFT_472526 [Xylaria digitata]
MHVIHMRSSRYMKTFSGHEDGLGSDKYPFPGVREHKTWGLGGIMLPIILVLFTARFESIEYSLAPRKNSCSRDKSLKQPQGFFLRRLGDT